MQEGTLAQRRKATLVKLLGMGDPGTGKTGSLVEVINNMGSFGLERVVIQDWDDGLDILATHVKPEALDKVFFATLRDELKPVPDGSEPVPRISLSPGKKGYAWTEGMMLLNNWKTEAADLGPAVKWGPETLFVSDTITGMGDAAVNFIRYAGGIENMWKATGRAMALQDKYIQLCLCLKCHFVLFSHVRFMGGGGQEAIEDPKHEGVIKYREVNSRSEGTAYPSALGQILPTQVGRHFNAQLEWKIQANRRRVNTVPSDKMALKLPLRLAKSLDQETALVKVFEAVQALK